MSNKYLDIAMEKVIKQEVNKELEDIKAEIIKWIEIDVGSSNYDAGLKRALCIIDKHISGKEQK